METTGVGPETKTADAKTTEMKARAMGEFHRLPNAKRKKSKSMRVKLIRSK